MFSHIALHGVLLDVTAGTRGQEIEEFLEILFKHSNISFHFVSLNTLLHHFNSSICYIAKVD